jgi:hypothetical protein
MREVFMISREAQMLRSPSAMRALSKPSTKDVRGGLVTRTFLWLAEIDARDGRGSAGEGTLGRRRQRQGVGVADVELGVSDEQAVREELSEVGLRPSVHDGVNDLVQVGARVDVVGDAGGDDREDVRGALGAFVEPGE